MRLHDGVPSAHVGAQNRKKFYLCFLPPTTETFSQNVLTCHHQLAQWYGALESEPPVMNPGEFGWEADHANKTLSPRTVRGEVPLAPESVLKLIRYGCESK